jgi:RNA methyltransferase, TrmH family
MPVNRVAVFDGFHAWKHATRFDFELTDAITDDPDGLDQLIADLCPDRRPYRDAVRTVSEADMRIEVARLGLRNVHHTRIVAWGVIPTPNLKLLSGTNRFARSSVPSVLVDGARHPGNLGAVVRVCAAAGSPAVFSLGPLDPWHPDVVRGGAGLHAAVSVLQLANLDALDGPVFALDADGVDIGSFAFPPGAILAVGAERDGVSEAVRQRADHIVSLPMRAGVSSLNLATSVSAALYVHLSRSNSGNSAVVL